MLHPDIISDIRREAAERVDNATCLLCDEVESLRAKAIRFDIFEAAISMREQEGAELVDLRAQVDILTDSLRQEEYHHQTWRESAIAAIAREESLQSLLAALKAERDEAMGIIEGLRYQSSCGDCEANEEIVGKFLSQGSSP